jgi:hypothetical protein
MSHAPTAGAGGDPVPAVPESEAGGDTAALYADIRATLGVPVVNLVWRHLATMPGGLDWCWAAVKPLYTTGAIAAEAEALRASLPLPELPRLPVEVLEALGLTAADRAGIAGVLTAYDRSNAMNLIALSALLMRLDGAGTGASPAIARLPSTAGDEAALPKLLTSAEMAPATAALVRRLNLLGERADGSVVASMYRHLAHWPAYLALAWVSVAPLEADGRLRPAIAAGLEQGRTRARALTGGLGEPSREPDTDVRRQVREALDLFTTHPIGKMVTICRLLRRSFPA